jgi:hypothetical protein
MRGLLTGHCHLKGHLCKLRQVNSSECGRWKQDLKWLDLFFVTGRLWPHKIQAPGSRFYETR